MPQKTGVIKAEMMDEMDETDEMVSTVQFSVPDGKGLREWAAVIEYSWEHEVNEGELVYSRVTEIFADHVIVCHGYGPKAKYFSVPYMVTADGEVEFDMENKTKVKLQTEWVAKMFHKMLDTNDESPLCVKSIGENRIGGYGIVWGDESKRDVDNQWFTKATNSLLDVFTAVGKLPWMVHHAADNVIKSTVVGVIDTLELDDVGMWYEAKIVEQDLYKKYVSKLVNSGKLFSSSGALPYSVKVAKNGEITDWATAEISGTWIPADFNQMLGGHTVSELKSFYKSIGINSDDIFADESSTTESVTETDAEEAAETAKAQEIELAQMWLDLQNLETNL